MAQRYVPTPVPWAQMHGNSAEQRHLPKSTQWQHAQVPNKPTAFFSHGAEPSMDQRRDPDSQPLEPTGAESPQPFQAAGSPSRVVVKLTNAQLAKHTTAGPKHSAS